MQPKTWSAAVRVVNLLSSTILIAFEVWFSVELILRQSVYQIILRIFAPIFLILFAFLIITSEYKYKKVVEYFKFLQSLYGLAYFNFFLASILSFQFSTVDRTFSIVVSSFYLAFGITFIILGCLKPKSIDDQLTTGLNTK